MPLILQKVAKNIIFMKPKKLHTVQKGALMHKNVGTTPIHSKYIFQEILIQNTCDFSERQINYKPWPVLSCGTGIFMAQT